MAEVADPILQAFIEKEDREYQKYLESQRGLTEAKPVIKDTSAPIANVIAVFKKWLHVEEDYAIVGPMCAAIANFCPGEPDIVGIVGASGSGKTEVIRSLGTEENDLVFPVSTITEKTLISGYEDKTNEDLAPRLRGRLLTIKDFTSILSERDAVRSVIFGQFREMTDGYIYKEYGNGVIKNHQGLHSSVLFASTNAIERYYSMSSKLGQRMIFLRPRSDPTEAGRRAKANRGKEDEMRGEIHKVVHWSSVKPTTPL
jgi:hypothetical protein